MNVLKMDQFDLTYRKENSYGAAAGPTPRVFKTQKSQFVILSFGSIYCIYILSFILGHLNRVVNISRQQVLVIII